MRAATKGTFYKDEIICGFPISVWIALTEECHAIGVMSYQFIAWPNGRSLIEQEQCVVDIFKIILIELIKEFADGKK